MTERDAPDPLKELEKRLEQAGSRPSGARSSSGASSNAMAMGLRIGLELVVGVIVGVAAGWLLDRWLGSRPWGLIAGFFLGTAAGMLNVYRAVAGLGMAAGYRAPTSKPAERRGGGADPAQPSDEWDED
jgi:ATP synthase protein I